MLNENQLNDKTYLELHEQVTELLENGELDEKKMVEWFLSTNYLDEQDIIEHIITPFLEQGMYSSHILKKMLTFKLKGVKND